MELVLPNNYVALEQEEMMYLDGGDWNTFKNNIKGLARSSSGFRFAARETGLWAARWSTRVYSYTYVVSAFAPILGSVAAVNAALAVIGGISVAGITYALWTHKFY